MGTVYAQLAMNVIIIIALSVTLYFINEYIVNDTRYKNIKNVIFGILFGVLAIMGTENGIPYEGFVLNVRDAGPICAGMLFSPLSGIVAGLIGGIERYLAVNWGVGAYTQVACTIGTIFAGLIGALIKISLFKDSRPRWYYGIAAAVVCEVVHFSFVLITHPDDLRTAYEVISIVFLPMIIANAVAVGVSCWILYSIDESHVGKTRYRTISMKFQSFTVILVAICLTLSISSSVYIQSTFAVNESKEALVNNLNDVLEQVEDISDDQLMEKTKAIAEVISGYSKRDYTTKNLASLLSEYGVVEINLIDKDGVIKVSSNPSFKDFNMYSGAQSIEFMEKLKLDGKVVLPLQPIAYDDSIYRKYAGLMFTDGWSIQVGYDKTCIIREAKSSMKNIATHRRVDKNGWMLILDDNYMIVSSGKGDVGKHATYIGLNPWSNNVPEYEMVDFTCYDEEFYAMYTYTEGYIVLALLPVEEANFNKNLFSILIGFIETIVFAILFLAITQIVERVIVRNVHKFNEGFQEITDGELEVEIEDIPVEEFSRLADDANKTVVKLKTLIDEAARKVEDELQFAKSIQEGALERVFPPFPDETRFDIHCTMDTAKEVGGDFYDFFFIDENTLGFEVADVSGKGIPAAMFMMTGKTLIKSMAEQRISTGEILRKTNEELCAHNEAGMFITCWMGILDLTTGVIQYTCAGHNPPLIKRKDGQYEYLKSKINLVLAAMEGVPYDVNEVKLEEGDELFIYTDGVTEATNVSDELYGEERLQNVLNRVLPKTAKDVCEVVKEDIDLFVGFADQFDDITMMSLKFGTSAIVDEGKKMSDTLFNKKDRTQNKVVFLEEEEEEILLVSGSPINFEEETEENREFQTKEITVDASTDTIPIVTDFIDEQLELLDCPMREAMQIDIAIDEIMSNIAYYAYAPEVGPATVIIEFDKDNSMIKITFVDHGTPYDPLKKADPDTGLALEERGVGGLGIYMVKQSMDDIIYEYTDGENRLTLVKKIGEEKSENNGSVD